MNTNYLNLSVKIDFIYVLLPIICLLFGSCTNKNELKADLKNLLSKSIKIPDDITIKYNGKDTVIKDLFDSELKLIVYSDSISCSSCKIGKLYLWEPFIEYAKSFNKRLKFYFIFYPTGINKNKIRISLMEGSINYPIIIDEKGEFEKLNPHLPKKEQFHTFLLDKNNNVVLVGNPLNNNEIKKMFYQKTQELLNNEKI